MDYYLDIAQSKIPLTTRGWKRINGEYDDPMVVQENSYYYLGGVRNRDATIFIDHAANTAQRGITWRLWGCFAHNNSL